MGGPISRAQIHRIMQGKGVTEFGYEGELEAIETEAETGGTGNPLGPEDDEADEAA